MKGSVGEDFGVGCYTFVGHRGCSVADYVLSKPDFFSNSLNISRFKSQIFCQTFASLNIPLNWMFFQNTSEQTKNYESISGKTAGVALTK